VTTAREQARQAATRFFTEDSDIRPFYEAGADAASDVWEPLCRDLLTVVAMLVTHAQEDLVPEQESLLDRTYFKAREALG
jgi:hypothetical protein